MSDIKQKQRTPIKNINKSIIYTERIKNHAISIKDKANDYSQGKEEEPTNYATQNIIDAGKLAGNEGVSKLNEEGNKSVIKTKDNVYKAKNKIDEIKANRQVKAERKKLEDKVKNDSKNIINSKTKGNIKKKKSIINHSKGKSIKGVTDKTTKLTVKQIKSTQYITKKTELAAKESVKLSKKAYQISKVAAKKIAQTTRRTIIAIVKVVKATLIAAKAAFAFILAGGWIAVIAVLICCIMGGAMALYQANGKENSEKGIYNEAAWNSDMVVMAISQLGNKGGEPYWSWYGFESRVEWCACFVSWCANQTGRIESGNMPKFSACNDGIAWFKEKHQWIEASDMPMTGDIIFFDWNKDGQDGSSDHVGIVEYYDVETNIVHTVEGNSNDECKQREYSKDDNQIMGYGRPAF